MFVTTGDLVSELDVAVSVAGRRGKNVGLGGDLHIASGDDVTVRIRLRDPAGPNAGGHSPSVARVDLIVGSVTGPTGDRTSDRNPTTRVERRFTAGEWQRNGEYLTMSHTLRNVRQSSYIRLRGTNTGELEPASDPAGEDPWRDLWFYANPVFISIKS